jgi:hypothetical protein
MEHTYLCCVDGLIYMIRNNYLPLGETVVPAMKPATTRGLEDEPQRNLECYQPNMVV